jgi:hypothetical protein
MYCEATRRERERERERREKRDKEKEAISAKLGVARFSQEMAIFACLFLMRFLFCFSLFGEMN